MYKYISFFTYKQPPQPKMKKHLSLKALISENLYLKKIANHQLSAIFIVMQVDDYYITAKEKVERFINKIQTNVIFSSCAMQRTHSFISGWVLAILPIYAQSSASGDRNAIIIRCTAILDIKSHMTSDDGITKHDYTKGRICCKKQTPSRKHNTSP